MRDTQIIIPNPGKVDDATYKRNIQAAADAIAVIEIAGDQPLRFYECLISECNKQIQRINDERSKKRTT